MNKLSHEAWLRRRALVFDALNNGLENGYEMVELAKRTPEEVAEDLVSFVASLEDEDPDYLIPHIKAWQEAAPEDRETVTCSICKEPCVLATAHRHQGEWIGDECWDERLRSSE